MNGELRRLRKYKLLARGDLAILREHARNSAGGAAIFQKLILGELEFENVLIVRFRVVEGDDRCLMNVVPKLITQPRRVSLDVAERSGIAIRPHHAVQ